MGKKTRDLAALAGLAGLAYAYNKNKGDSSTTDTGDETDRLKGRGKPEESRRKIEDYQKKAPEDEKGSAQSDVLKAVTSPKAASNDKAGNQGVLPQKSSTAVNPKPKRIGMTGAQNDALATAGKQSKATSENNALAKVNRGMGREVTEAAKADAAPASSTSKVADTVKTVAKTVARGPIGVAADAAKPLADKATNTMRETYRDLSGKVQYKTPDIPSAAKTASDAVASGAKKVGSGIADYVKNFETPAERRSREAKESKDAPPKARTDSPLGRKMESEVLNNMITNPPMRKGGMVKMASGGMTASRRGDGIASRGKTRGKIC